MPKKDFREPKQSLSQKALVDSQFRESAERDAEMTRLRDQVASLMNRNKDAARLVAKLQRENAAFQTLEQTEIVRAEIALKRTAPKGQAAAMIFRCDCHAGETVDPTAIDYPNEHNEKVWRRRNARFLEKAALLLDLARKFADVREFHYVVAGDMMTNYLHEDQVETNWCGPMEEMLEVRDQLATEIAFFRRELGDKVEFRVTTCHGNHGRIATLSGKKKKHKAQHTTNLEWQLCENLARDSQRRGEPIAWNVGRTNSNWLSAAGHFVRVWHADTIRYEGGVGGLTIPLNKAVHRLNANRRAAYTLVAHWHQFMRQWNTIVCGCQVGYTEFCQAKTFEGQPPTQTFLLFDAELGLILCEPLFVGDTE
jgi:hypothetical protein